MIKSVYKLNISKIGLSWLTIRTLCPLKYVIMHMLNNYWCILGVLYGIWYVVGVTLPNPHDTLNVISYGIRK